jgi:DNA polymerase III epsilon subunit-like protein
MKDIMLDIETLGTGYNSVVVQVAMVYFDRYTKQTGSAFCMNIDPESCIEYGLKTDKSTLDWWETQPKEVQESVLTNGKPLPEVLNEIRKFIKYGSIIWCHATFDVPLLENAFKATNIVVPWKYTNVRDLRTIVDISGIDLKTYKWDEFKTHNALEDCCFQINYTTDCINKINKGLKTDGIPNN